MKNTNITTFYFKMVGYLQYYEYMIGFKIKLIKMF